MFDYQKLTSDLSINPDIKKNKASLTDYLLNEMGIPTENFSVDFNPFSKSIGATVYLENDRTLKFKASKKGGISFSISAKL